MSHTRSSLSFCVLATALLLGGITTPAFARKKEPGLASIRYFERIARADRRESAAGARRSFSFRVLARQFDLDLEPNRILAPAYRGIAVGNGGSERDITGSMTLYKGKLRGRGDTWVRLALRDGALEGLVWTPEEVYVFQPAKSLIGGAPADETVAYRVSDIDTDLGPGSCAAEAAPVVSLLRRAAPAGAGSAAGGGGGGAVSSEAVTVSQAEIGLVADYEYFLDHGSDATAAANTMLGIINQIDGIYQAQLGVSFLVVDTVVYTTSNDPFSSTTTPSTLLSELASYRNNPASPVYGDDLVHLFTGRDLAGSVVGIAYVGAVCDYYYGCGLSENYSTNNNIRVVLTAHEIGHNFNARHDDSIGSGCVGSPPYIMHSSVGSTSQQVFSSIPSCSPYCCSREAIGAYVPGASCLTSVLVGTATPTPSPTPAPPTATVTRTRTTTWTGTATFTRTNTLSPTITATATVTNTPGPATATPSATSTPANVPPSIPGLLLWLDASQISGLSGGSQVASWFDVSGLGYHALQSTSSRRPTYQVNVINGRPAVRFDGSNDYLRNSGFDPLSGRSGVTAFVLFRAASTSGNRVGFSESARNLNQQVYSGSVYTYATSGVHGRAAFTSTAFTLWNSIFDGTQSGNAGRLRLYIDGVPQGLTYTGTVPALLNGASGYEVGRSYGSETGYWTGDIAEVIVYGRTLNEGERQTVESYLSQKYALGIGPSVTFTPTSTAPPAATSTNTATRTNTVPPANTATATSSFTAAPPTSTRTSTNTAPPANTATATRTHTSTWTHTATPVAPTATPTPPGISGPQAVAGLALWLDASQITGLVNGSPVTAWNDLSGAGNHLSQSTSAVQPKYRTNVINGKPVVTFDGVNDYLRNTTFGALNAKTGATAFVVFKTDNTSANHIALCDSARNVQAQVYAGSVYAYATAGNSGRFASSSLSFAIWNSVYDGTQSDNASRLRLYYNGVQRALTFSGTVPSVLGSGAGYEVGRPYGSNLAYWDGDIAEVVVYARALSDTERQQVTSYLGGKYGIATN